MAQGLWDPFAGGDLAWWCKSTCWFPFNPINRVWSIALRRTWCTNSISIKFDKNLQCSGLKCAQSITMKFCIYHYSVRDVCENLLWCYEPGPEHFREISLNFKFNWNIVGGTDAKTVTFCPGGHWLLAGLEVEPEHGLPEIYRFC